MPVLHPIAPLAWSNHSETPAMSGSTQTPPCRFERSAPRRGPATGQIAGVVFGFENVLFDATAWQRHCCRVLASGGLTISPERFDRLWRHAPRRSGPRLCDGSFPGRLRWCLAALGLTAGWADEVVAACRSEHRAAAEEARGFAFVPVVIGGLLDRGLQVAVRGGDSFGPESTTIAFSRLALDPRVERIVPGSIPGRGSGLADIAEYWGFSGGRLAYVGLELADLAEARRLGWRAFTVSTAGGGRPRPEAEWLSLVAGAKAA